MSKFSPEKIAPKNSYPNQSYSHYKTVHVAPSTMVPKQSAKTKLKVRFNWWLISTLFDSKLDSNSNLECQSKLKLESRNTYIHISAGIIFSANRSHCSINSVSFTTFQIKIYKSVGQPCSECTF